MILLDGVSRLASAGRLPTALASAFPCWFQADRDVGVLLESLKQLLVVDTLHVANDGAIDQTNAELAALIAQSFEPS